MSKDYRNHISGIHSVNPATADLVLLQAPRRRVPAGTPLSNTLENGRFKRAFVQKELIGSGGFGAVFATEHPNGDWSAVKMIAVDMHADARERVQFTEVLAMKSMLSTKYVVRYQECWLEERIFVADYLPMSHKEIPEPVARSESSFNYHDFSGTILDCDDGFEWVRNTESPRRSRPSPVHGKDATESPRRRPRAAEDTEDMYEVVLLIQMELCKNMAGQAIRCLTFREWLDRPNRTQEREHMMKLFEALMLGVRHIHRQRVVHRDLKPANIFVLMSPQPTMKIGDFGLAMALKDLRPCGAVGTPGYIAPELSNGVGPCTDKADVFSCGIMLFELLHPPFMTIMERHSVLNSLVHKHELPLKSIEILARMPKLRRLILSMVIPNPSLRISAEEVCKRIKDEVTSEWRRALRRTQSEARSKRKAKPKLRRNGS